MNVLKNICKKENVYINDVNFYHYGNIEKNIYEKIIDKYNCPERWLINNDYLRFCDILKIFKNEPIVVRSSLKFGLKSIAQAFINNKLIKNKKLIKGWNNCNNGLEAMIEAHNVYSMKAEKHLEKEKNIPMNFKITKL